MQKSSKRRLDPLYDVSAFTLPDRDLEGDLPESQRSTSEIVKPMAECSHTALPHETPVHKNQIMRHMEYHVTEQQKAEAQMSPEEHNAYAYQTANGWQQQQQQGPNGYPYGPGTTGRAY